MGTAKQAALVGALALAIALVIVSYYTTFLSGPKPMPPEEGKKWKAIMERQIQEQETKTKALIERQGFPQSDAQEGHSPGVKAKRK